VGHVSSPSRQVPDLDSKNMVSFIQTDAAVNPGNSGGALANMYGQVIGIVSAKFSVQGGYESIGFAISMDSAKPIIDDILDKGYVQNRPKVGIIYAPISEGDAKDLGVVKGLYVTTIAEDSDIKNTELQIYDIITEMNGVRVYDAETVQEALSGLNVGDVVKAKVYRKSIIDEVNEFEIEFKMVEDRG
ncbi:MAG: PDZ domain-containing protein, partial [Oscillospiraceae bacterium]